MQPGPRPTGRALELLVVEGTDAGSQFTVDGETIRIGRGALEAGRTGAVCLSDPTVSPRQAYLHVSDTDVAIEHREGATNPTLVNGRAIGRTTIEVGDRIQMGRTLIEVRSRPGITLSGLLTIRQPTESVERSDHSVAAATTEIRPPPPRPAALVVLEGVPGLDGRRFPLRSILNRVGRHSANDVVLDEPGVSRFHAELFWLERQLHLLHKSETNPTSVDGVPVEERVLLRDGQTIQLADRVMLRVEIPDEAVDASRPPPSLRDLIEEKVRRDAEIERDYGFIGSFLDLDVVDSHGLKVSASRPEHIILSFERFRAFAQGVVEEHEGRVLNSNGDELMCYFDAGLAAVRAAIALVDRLEAFNARENLLPRPFCVRQGIHTGASLLDRVRGVAYSPVLDVAGHLQKYAPENGLLISAATLSLMPEGLAFAPAGEVGKERVLAYRLEASQR